MATFGFVSCYGFSSSQFSDFHNASRCTFWKAKSSFWQCSKYSCFRGVRKVSRTNECRSLNSSLQMLYAAAVHPSRSESLSWSLGIFVYELRLGTTIPRDQEGTCTWQYWCSYTNTTKPERTHGKNGELFSQNACCEIQTVSELSKILPQQQHDFARACWIFPLLSSCFEKSENSRWLYFYTLKLI